MNSKDTLLRIGGLTLILTFLFWIPIPGIRGQSEVDTIVYWLLVAFFHTLVLSYLIINSNWNGWKLILVTFIMFYSTMTFQSQVETLVFLTYFENIIPSKMIPKLFIKDLLSQQFSRQ